VSWSACGQGPLPARAREMSATRGHVDRETRETIRHTNTHPHTHTYRHTRACITYAQLQLASAEDEIGAHYRARIVRTPLTPSFSPPPHTLLEVLHIARAEGDADAAGGLLGDSLSVLDGSCSGLSQPLSAIHELASTRPLTSHIHHHANACANAQHGQQRL
jgi:hypothetical protein